MGKVGLVRRFNCCRELRGGVNASVHGWPMPDLNPISLIRHSSVNNVESLLTAYWWVARWPIIGVLGEPPVPRNKMSCCTKWTFKCLNTPERSNNRAENTEPVRHHVACSRGLFCVSNFVRSNMLNVAKSALVRMTWFPATVSVDGANADKFGTFHVATFDCLHHLLMTSSQYN